MAGSQWFSLTAGKVARAGDVNADLAWLEGSLAPMNGGSTTTGVHDIGTTTAVWRTIYTNSLAGTSTANGVAIGTTSVANNSDVALELAGIKSFLCPRMTTAQKNNLAAINGMLVYDSTLGLFQMRQAGSWISPGGSTFQTKARTVFAGTGAATQTALNIASGGGKLLGLAFLKESSAADLPQIRVQLDSVNTLDVTFLGTLNTYWICDGAGTFHQGGFATSTSNILVGHSTTAMLGANGLDWEFASTLTIYIAANTNATGSAVIVYSQKV